MFVDTSTAVSSSEWARLCGESMQVGAAMGRQTGDFDATVPPPDMIRLHEQLRDAAREVSGAIKALGSVATALANPCVSAVGGCDAEGLKDAFSQQALRVINRIYASDDGYVEARNRAAKMLGGAGATLAEFPLRR